MRRARQKQISQKHIYMEALRIPACFFVIFNHTANMGYFLFEKYPPNTFRYWYYMTFSIFCRFSVPVFFMLSGALLLAKDQESIKDIYKKRVSRIALILLVYSLLYYIIDVCQGRAKLGAGVFFLQFWSTNWNFSYWYLYAFLAFLISLPLLRMMAKNFEKKHYIYMMILYIVFQGILPVVQYLLWHEKYNLNQNLRVKWILADIVLFPLLGYFLHHKVTDLSHKGTLILKLWIANITTILISCYMTHIRAVYTGVLDRFHSNMFHDSFVMVNAVTLFLTTKYLFEKLDGHLPRFVTTVILSIGSCTFGMYLWHVLFIKKIPPFNQLWNIFDQYFGPNRMISAILYCLCIMICTYIITRIQKLIPLLKKLV